jgi:hypothetical protein
VHLRVTHFHPYLCLSCPTGYGLLLVIDRTLQLTNNTVLHILIYPYVSTSRFVSDIFRSCYSLQYLYVIMFQKLFLEILGGFDRYSQI